MKSQKPPKNSHLEISSGPTKEPEPNPFPVQRTLAFKRKGRFEGRHFTAFAKKREKQLLKKGQKKRKTGKPLHGHSNQKSARPDWGERKEKVVEGTRKDPPLQKKCRFPIGRERDQGGPVSEQKRSTSALPHNPPIKGGGICKDRKLASREANPIPGGRTRRREKKEGSHPFKGKRKTIE